MLEALIIESKEDTPKVVLDSANKVFQISARSLPENAIGFYEPVLKWLNDYSAEPLELTVFDFTLEYFNTASAKQIAARKKFMEMISSKKKGGADKEEAGHGYKH